MGQVAGSKCCRNEGDEVEIDVIDASSAGRLPADIEQSLELRKSLNQKEMDIVHQSNILDKLLEKDVMVASGLLATDLQRFAEFVTASPAGSVFVVPTDTVYCLISRASDTLGVQTLYAVKDRKAEKPVSLWIPSFQSLCEDDFHPVVWDFMNALWPSRVSVVLNKGPWLHKILPDWENSRVGSQGKGRGNSIAIRVPDFTIDLVLMEKIGPMVVTSANPSGGIDVVDWMESAFEMALKHKEVRGILCGGFAPSFGEHSGESPASTVISLVDFAETAENLLEPDLPVGFKIGTKVLERNEDLKILRHGVVLPEQLQTTWQKIKCAYSTDTSPSSSPEEEADIRRNRSREVIQNVLRARTAVVY